jgi:nucleobase:cation symporter-1, NCS1 family
MSTGINGRTGEAVVTNETTTARLPIRPRERIYKSYFSFLFCGVTCCASSLMYAIGGALPFVGNTILALIGYLCGLMVCLIPAVLAGTPSFRYGLDTTDAIKTALGVRGAATMLVGIVGSGLGWSFILMAISARSFANLVRTISGTGGGVNEMYVVGFAFVTLVVLWVLSKRGAAGMERVTTFIAPVQLAFAAILLALLIHRFSLSELLHANVEADKAYTADPKQRLALAFEFGFTGVLGFFPFIGGLTRLVSRRKHLVGPMVTGGGFIGSWFIAAVSSFAAVLSGTADPTIWVVTVGGRWFGSGLLLFMLLANVGTMVIYVYVAAAASQQIKALGNIRWSWLIAILLLPGAYCAVRTEWLLENVITFMTYSGLFFAGALGVILVDYFILRRQRIDPVHVFTLSREGDYWFWGGVNWIGIGVSILGSAVYLWMYDPVTLRTVPAFRFIGAGLPVCTGTAILYFVLMKTFVVRGVKGGYPQSRRDSAKKVEVTL